jgi:predicted AAA+ superfamily ATPase
MSNSVTSFVRAQGAVLAARLGEPRRHIQLIAGPRQTGKTTLVLQTLEPFAERARYASADEPTLRDRAWIGAQWDAARLVARRHDG